MRMSAWEAEKQLHELHKAIYEEVDLTHPIVHNGNNVCSLVKEGNLKANLKLAELKEMCLSFGIDIDGPPGRNNSYLRPLEALV